MQPQLTPYVPRLVLEWQRDTPAESWRAIEGTLVFIDLSGFTAMSEKLARKGKVGAEEVTDALNSTFSALLSVAYEVGGSLLKFGGDALLLFFAEDGHAERGTYAAAEMRRTLRRIGRIKTSAGTFSLKMTVGVHSGEFRFFLVGSTHRELIVTGPDATKTVLMESSADAGEILLSPQTSERIDRSLLGEFKDGGCLLSKVPPSPAAKETPSLPESVEIDEFIPSAVRKHLSAGGEEADHRQVTVAFIHFEGADALLSESGPGRTAEALESLVSEVQAAAEEFGVSFLSTDIDEDGGKIILTAGAPLSTENNDERMLRALRRIVDSKQTLGLRIGVQKGHVFAGVVGPFYRRTYTVMGDAVNTAARVMSRAEPGEILATEPVLDGSDVLFEATEKEPFAVKGKARPITAFGVGSPKGLKRLAIKHEIPLVGREPELRRLLDLLRDARAGSVVLAEIVGEAGIGKSRLILELRKQAEPSSVYLESACQQYEAATPYFAFRDVLRSIFGIKAGDEPEASAANLRARLEEVAPELVPWAPLIGIPMDLEISSTPEVDRLDPDLRKDQVHRVTTAALAGVAASPTVWVFEDAHWMDQSSRELLSWITENVVERPWLICVTTRPGDSEISGDIPGATRIDLKPLSSDESTRLARVVADDMLLPQHATVLARRAGGHPLFLIELVASFSGSDDLGALPASVEAVIATRIDQLAPRDRGLLRILSVLGKESDRQFIQALMSDGAHEFDSAAWTRLSEFVEITGGVLRFRQALIRDVAYEGLPYRQRRTVHERAGSILEARSADPRENAEILSLHFSRALNYEKAWRYSRLAADRAVEKFAYVAAAAFYAQALESVRRLTVAESEEVAFVWESLGVARLRTQQFAEAAQAYKHARRLVVSNRATLARLHWREGLIRGQLGKYPEALRWFSKGLRLVEAPDQGPEERKVRVQLMVAYGEARYRQGQISVGIRWLHRAASEAEAIDDRADLALAYYVLLNAYSDVRDPRAGKYGELALALFEETGELRLKAQALNGLGIEAYQVGDWERSLSLYERSRESLELAGHVLGAAIVANNIGEILADQGKLEESGNAFREALSVAKASHHALATAVTTMNLGRVAAKDGRFKESDELFEEALGDFRKLGSSSFAAETEVRMAESLVMRGRAEDALRISAAGAEKVPPKMHPLVNRVRGLALMQAGRAEEARAMLDESLRLAREGAQEFETALSHRALALLAIHAAEESKGHETEAESILRKLGVVRTPQIPS